MTEVEVVVSVVVTVVVASRVLIVQAADFGRLCSSDCRTTIVVSGRLRDFLDIKRYYGKYDWFVQWIGWLHLRFLLFHSSYFADTLSCKWMIEE